MITVNGEALVWQPGLTVGQLLAHRGLDPARVAVELDGAIVAREQFAVREVPDEARVEVVHFVGGG